MVLLIEEAFSHWRLGYQISILLCLLQCSTTPRSSIQMCTSRQVFLPCHHCVFSMLSGHMRGVHRTHPRKAQEAVLPSEVQGQTKQRQSLHLFCAQTGEICLDILKNAWSPAWTLQSTCQAIVALMSDAAPDSPLNCDAGNLLRAGDVRGYNSLARMYTAEHALPK